ncbi:hypothetical protein E4T43_00933 [Aureobasidium subglaciale]|nr:hypothetical protein E4T43_00933 [Aureobasidium subglaciale]
MLYIPNVRDLNAQPPPLSAAIRRLRTNHPARRQAELKRKTYSRDHALLCLVGIIPAKSASSRRPDRQLPRAPLPPFRPRSRARVFPLPLPTPPLTPPASFRSTMPAASGPSLPRLTAPPILRAAPTAVTPSGRVKKAVVSVTTDRVGDRVLQRRLLKHKPARVLSVVNEESINHIKMARSNDTDNDLCLVPPGSENAVPTVRGIIEEYYEEKEHEQSGGNDKRTPVYLSPKLAHSKLKTVHKTNADPIVDSSVVRVPPKAQQLLGSPQHNNSDWRRFGRVDRSPLHSKSASVNKSRHTTSSKVVSLLTPSKLRKISTSALPHSQIHTSSSSQHTSISRAQNEFTSPLKHSTTLYPTTTRSNMSAQSPPDKQTVAGASPSKSPVKPIPSPAHSGASLPRSVVSPKKEDFSLKRAFSTLTPKRLRQDRPPTPPRKDTPPPQGESSAELRPSANITDVGRAFDAYSGNAFASAPEDDKASIKSTGTITIAIGDECGPVQEVKAGVLRFTHQPHSMFKGQQAVFDADPEIVRQIDEEFQSPPLPASLFRTPRSDKGAFESADKSVANKTPRYIEGGLLEGGLLPATTYQPPSSREEKTQAIYSPSLYSVQDGHDVFRVDHSVAQEFAATSPVPNNSVNNSPEAVNQVRGDRNAATTSREQLSGGRSVRARVSSRVAPVQYIGTIAGNDYVYKPEDHVSDRARVPVAGTPVQRVGAPFEYPSAVPPPLRRTSRDRDVSSGSSSAPSLRERFMNKSGLGINVSESSDYFADNETTLGVDGDGNEERRRETISMRTPAAPSFTPSFKSPAVPQMWPTARNVNPHGLALGHDDKYWLNRAFAHLAEDVKELNDQTMESIDKLAKKTDALTQTDSQHTKTVADIYKAIAALQQVVKKSHDDARDSFRDFRSVRDGVDNIRRSIIHMSEFLVDDEKVELVCDKIISTVHPTIVRGHEYAAANTERILTRVDKCHDQMARELESLKQKNRKTNERLASLEARLLGPRPGQVQNGVHPSPSSSNGYLDVINDYAENINNSGR